MYEKVKRAWLRSQSGLIELQGRDTGSVQDEVLADLAQRKGHMGKMEGLKP